MTATENPAPAQVPSQDRLLGTAYLPFVVAAVGLVTMGAFENRAVTTVLPTVAEHLDGLAWFGAATAAPVATYVIGTTLSGAWADRRGPRGPLLAGLVAFGIAQAVAGFAPHMAVFTGARLIGGAAEGAMDIALTVMIASVLPEAMRPKMFAAISAAWVLPSVVGPGIAGAIAEAVGWRWVFAAPVPLLVVAALLLVPSLRRVRAREAERAAAGLVVPEGEGSGRLAVQAGLLATALAAVSLVGPLFEHADTRLVGATALVAATVAALVVGARILPRGTYRLWRGIPSVVAMNGLIGTAFGLGSAFIPLMLVAVLGVRPIWAGASLTVTGVFWAAGSFVQSLAVVQRNTTAASRLRIGSLLIAVGTLGPVLVALGRLPLVPGLAVFALAAMGIGLSYPTIATQSLALAPEEEQGQVTAARQLSAAMAQALALAVAGAFVAMAGQHLSGALFAWVGAAAIVVALVAAAASGRVTSAR